MAERGRPPVGPRLEVRVTDEQMAKLKRIADSQDRSLAWVIRDLIESAADVAGSPGPT